MTLINILAMTVMVSITGSIVFGIWFFLRKRLEKINPKIVYHLLHIVLLTYLLPIVYILLVFFYTGTTINEIYLLDEANRLYQYATVISLVWIIVVSVLTILEVQKRIKFNKFCRLGFPVTDQRIWAILEDIKSQYQIKKDIKLLTHRGIQSPMIVGSYKPILLLPEVQYTMEEVRMVFMHELAHYKNHDYGWKQLTVIIKLIHCFNPVVYRLLKHVDRWSEIGCDISISKWNKISMNEYYNFILSQMVKQMIEKENKSFSHCLFKDGPELQERMLCTAKYKKRLWWKSILAIQLVIICCFLGVGVSYAASEQIVIKYNDIHSRYVTYKWETVYPIPIVSLEELPVMNQEELNTAEEIDMEDNGENYDILSLEGKLLPNKKKVSSTFTMEKGEEINLWVESQNGRKIKAGIICPNGECKFIVTSSLGSHLFEVDTDGEYKIFMENVDTKVAIGSVVDFSNE